MADSRSSKFSRDEDDPASLSHCAQLDMRRYALQRACLGYCACGLTLTGNDISRWLTQWKGTEGHEWLKLVPATCLTQCLRDQDAAFRNYFAGRAKYPKDIGQD